MQESTERVSVEVGKRELRQWKKYFMLYGVKTAFATASGISRQTLYSVLKCGKGEATTIEAVRMYFQQQTQQAA